MSELNQIREYEASLGCKGRCRKFYCPNNDDIRHMKQVEKHKTNKTSVKMNFNHEQWYFCFTKLIVQMILLAGCTFLATIYGFMFFKAREFNLRCDEADCTRVLYDMCYIPDNLMLQVFTEYRGNNTETFNLDDWTASMQPYQNFTL